MKKYNLSMLNVGHAIHDADWNFKDITSPFTRIYYVTEGEATVTFDSRSHKLMPGNMYIIPAFTRHSDSCDGKFCHYYLHIYEDVFVGEGIIENYEFPFGIEGEPMDRLLFDELCRHYSTMALKAADPGVYDTKVALIDSVSNFRKRPEWEQLVSVGIMCQLLSRFLRCAKPKYQITDPYVCRALELINSRRNEIVRVGDLAREVRVSTDYLIRLFKKYLGCTPARFITERKMMQAKLMLASESILTKEVAYTLGYDNPAYFSFLFQKHTGMTPTRYREMFNPNLKSGISVAE